MPWILAELARIFTLRVAVTYGVQVVASAVFEAIQERASVTRQYTSG